VYNKLQLASKYAKYYFTAANSKGHGTHSPFIFEFITKTLNDKNHYHAYSRVEGLRKKLLQDQTLLTVEDFGAGSGMDKTNQRTIASIAKNAAKPKKYARLLYRIANYYQPATMLELGTSLGISTSYLSLACPQSRIYTLEGSAAVAEIARRNFKQLELDNILLTEGNFDKTLSAVLKGIATAGLVFIDGNHRQEPTERYFKQLLPLVNSDTIFIFDDIHWSREMEAAWNTIREHPSVRCSVDLFFIGIVFFRAEFREKQHFTIRF
jgi:predicted O-methyltransferase YrrM